MHSQPYRLHSSTNRLCQKILQSTKLMEWSLTYPDINQIEIVNYKIAAYGNRKQYLSIKDQREAKENKSACYVKLKRIEHLTKLISDILKKLVKNSVKNSI